MKTSKFLKANVSLWAHVELMGGLSPRSPHQQQQPHLELVGNTGILGPQPKPTEPEPGV